MTNIPELVWFLIGNVSGALLAFGAALALDWPLKGDDDE